MLPGRSCNSVAQRCEVLQCSHNLLRKKRGAEDSAFSALPTHPLWKHFPQPSALQLNLFHHTSTRIA